MMRSYRVVRQTTLAITVTLALGCSSSQDSQKGTGAAGGSSKDDERSSESHFGGGFGLIASTARGGAKADGRSSAQQSAPSSGGSSSADGSKSSELPSPSGGWTSVGSSFAAGGAVNHSSATSGSAGSSRGGSAGTSGSAGSSTGGSAGASGSAFSCNENAIAEGQTITTGVANIDSYFAQVQNYRETAQRVTRALATSLDNIKALLALPPTASFTQIPTTINSQFQIDGTFHARVTPPTCLASTPKVLHTLYSCDPSLDTAAKASCMNRCVTELSQSAGAIVCASGAQPHCTSPAHGVQCSGVCKGRCKREVASKSCAGICVGTCTGNCLIRDANGKCSGACDGTCEGTCELPAGGICTGECLGECAIESTLLCDVNSRPECFRVPQAGGTVACDANCEGTVVPPPSLVECGIGAQIQADLEADCAIPDVSVAASVRTNAPAEVVAAYASFRPAFETELAYLALGLRRAELALNAAATIEAGVTPVAQSFESAAATANGDLQLVAAFSCAVRLMPKAARETQALIEPLVANANTARALLMTLR